MAAKTRRMIPALAATAAVCVLAGPAIAASGAATQVLFGTGTSNSHHGAFVATTIPDFDEYLTNGSKGNEYYLNAYRANYDYIASVGIRRRKSSDGFYLYEDNFVMHAQSSGIVYEAVTYLGYGVGHV